MTGETDASRGALRRAARLRRLLRRDLVEERDERKQVLSQVDAILKDIAKLDLDAPQ